MLSAKSSFFGAGLKCSLILLLGIALVSCGGGGGGGAGGSSAQMCAAPRPNTSDMAGSIDTEKSWVRDMMNEVYLWYKDVPSVNAANYTAAAYGGSNYRALDAYFTALKTPNRTASGKPVDQFSFTVPTADRLNQQAGISSGYGIRLVFIQSTPPRLLRVAYVEKGSPAETAGITRGDTITSLDGVAVVDGNPDQLNASLFPTTASKSTVFGIQSVGSSTSRNVTAVSSQSVAITPVTHAQTFTQGTNTVGYLTINSFSVNSAEKQLIDAITLLKSRSVNELVLDMRYNGGGFLDISNQLAWMIGSSNLAGKVYEKTICNDKKPFAICDTADTFQQTSQGFSQPAGQALPQLGLKRVFVLTSASTCSASESIINGLSPFMQVVRIGSTTCGKPYGFYYLDNCGTSYAAMQFKGANAVGFGDYADGFSPTCQVADDLSKQRGDTSELMLAGALSYISTGVCPAVSTGFRKSGSSADSGNYQILRSPLEEQRWYTSKP